MVIGKVCVVGRLESVMTSVGRGVGVRGRILVKCWVRVCGPSPKQLILYPGQLADRLRASLPLFLVLAQ